jgi:hypothetical protein
MRAAVLTLIFLIPVAALAQGGSPFDTGFTAIQSLFTGTIAKRSASPQTIPASPSKTLSFNFIE